MASSHRNAPANSDAIQNYFLHINPMARRIILDINNTKSNYGHMWCYLNYNEQNDIINETLIKPEISLKYFEKFPSSPSTLSKHVPNLQNSSQTNSESSLIAMIFNDRKCSQNSTGSQENTLIKYGFDGRNLKTYVLQAVALKVIHDENLGLYRDEHSVPFSFRTRSQMNLCMCENVKNVPITLDGSKKTQLPAFKTAENNDISNWHSAFLTAETATSSKLVRKSDLSHNQEDYIRSKDKGRALSNIKDLSIVMETSRIKVTNDKTPACTIAYSNSSEDRFDSHEKSNLIRNCLVSNLTLSSSSIPTSDDDNDCKTISEAANLLDSNISTKRVFDFLNNW